jgi:1-acyl-sn-glycerol-3-phosphate acyltransferase
MPDGPVLVIANHPNSVMDALIVMRVAGRPVRPLAKAPLFEDALIGHLLRGLGALPVFRPQDYPDETWKNEGTFKAAEEALLDGEAVLIFPEGLTHSEARLARMKTGAARIAFAAEEDANWQLGLRIVPVGLTYQRKHAIRGRVAIALGRSFAVSDWREMREKDEWSAVESLTDAMRKALETVTLNLPSQEDRSLLEAAEALYAAEKRLTKPRAREKLAPRLPRLQRFAGALAWLYVADPELYERIGDEVRTYRERLKILGVREGEVPKRFRPSRVLWYATVQGLTLLVGLPLAVAGTIAWYIPYKSPRVTLNIYKPPYEALAAFKLATALLAFPLAYSLYLAVAWWMGGTLALVAVAIVLPLLGIVALRWRDRWRMAREDVYVFWRTMRMRSLRDELVKRRQELVGEFEVVYSAWQRERRARERER